MPPSIDRSVMCGNWTLRSPHLTHSDPSIDDPKVHRVPSVARLECKGQRIVDESTSKNYPHNKPWRPTGL
jgi:hypothetical protein